VHFSRLLIMIRTWCNVTQHRLSRIEKREYAFMWYGTSSRRDYDLLRQIRLTTTDKQEAAERTKSERLLQDDSADSKPAHRW